MRRRFTLERIGRFRRSAARGMARAGFHPRVIAIVMRLPFKVAADIHACRHAPAGLWAPAERALFREIGR